VTQFSAPVALDSNSAIGIALALVAAIMLAVGTQMQSRGVSHVGDVGGASKTGLSIKELRALVAHPWWVVGTLLLSLAIVLQLTSLSFAPLTVVQPLGAVALVVTALINARITKVPLDRIAVRAIVVCVLGVATFVTVAAFVTNSHPITATQLYIVLGILVVILAVFVTLFLRMRRRTARPIFYVIAAGVLFGFVVTLAKVVIDRVKTLAIGDFQIDATDILTLLCVVGLLAAALLGTYLVQTAHSSNPPDIVVAGLTVIDPIVAVSIGIIVLGEAADAPLWAVIVFLLAAGAAIWGVVSLSRHHPTLPVSVRSRAAAGSAPPRS
jgi:hypothetical protein